MNNNIKENHVLIRLEENGFVTPDEKAQELVKELNDTKSLYALRLLFEDLQNEFSNQILINSLVALADPVSFKLHYTKEGTSRLELHLRTWIAILERICFSQICLTKELQNKIYNTLKDFVEIHRKTAHIVGEGIENIFKSEFYQFNKQDERIVKKRNYNIDFLLIQLRDTLHSLRENETWFQEVLRGTKDLLKASLKITPGIVSIVAPSASIPNGNGSILSTLTQLRRSLSFKYPVASYYVDWRIMMIIKRNFIKWSEGSEKILSKRHGEMILIEYIKAYLEREWIKVADKPIIDSKFDEESNRQIEKLRDTGRFFNNLPGNESPALPHSLWFGLLDLVHNLVQQSSKSSTYNQCYYLAIESLNKAPSRFIQFKAIEILLYLHDINSELFTMLDIDLDQYARELRENNFLINSSAKFKVLLEFIKKRYLKDVEITTEGKKGRRNNSYDEISDVPTDQIILLECQHMISLNNLKDLKQAKCPQCRLYIENNKIRHLSQNTIYKNVSAQFSKPGHISSNLPSIDFEDSDESDSDSDNLSEIEFELIKEKNLIRTTKSNSNTLFQAIMPNRSSKKQHTTYQNAMKELTGKNYERAIYWCKEFLKKFPKHYCIRCILGYIYRCLYNYEQAHVYLNEAIDIKPKNPIAYYINGEIYYRQRNYSMAIEFILKSIDYKIKMNNLNIILGSSYIFGISYKDCYNHALNNFNVVLKKDSNHYLSLKNCAFIYRKQEDHQKALEILDKLLTINRKDSLILCYYGEILLSLKKYNEAISYFTKANKIDPENVHNLIKRAITYLILEKYDDALIDINRILQLDSLYSLAYYYRGLIFYIMDNVSTSILDFKKCIQLSPNDDLAKIHLIFMKFMLHYRAYKKLSHKVVKIIAKIDRFTKINDQIKCFIKCNIYIKLKMYDKALENLNRLFDLNRQDIQFLYFLRRHSGFLKYLCSYYNLDNKFIGLGIVEKFYIYMHFVIGVYFVSNLVNIDSKYFHYIQEVNNKSLSRKVLHVKNEPLIMVLPNLLKPYWGFYIVWRICINDVSSKDCSLNFIIKDDDHLPHKHTLTYEDLSKLIGLGWIEYSLPFTLQFTWVKPSIEIKHGFIDMKIDYVRFISIERDQNYVPSVQPFLPLYKFQPDVPEAFEYRYFQKKELDNSLELKDILDYL
ncbi:550_t:CDS:2 [Funneliformis caledonium]|uniref:550_t:CDS:1 n=1 Tax=Funneliformis caledonium TaxID=1117310 RepID=A0A9N8ZDB0_9GLOM|nr:550_t:CDS:2 [Funneliformis caledonium]